MLCCLKLYNEELKNIKEFNYELQDGINVNIKEQRKKSLKLHLSLIYLVKKEMELDKVVMIQFKNVIMI